MTHRIPCPQFNLRSLGRSGLGRSSFGRSSFGRSGLGRSGLGRGSLGCSLGRRYVTDSAIGIIDTLQGIQITASDSRTICVEELNYSKQEEVGLSNDQQKGASPSSVLQDWRLVKSMASIPVSTSTRANRTVRVFIRERSFVPGHLEFLIVIRFYTFSGFLNDYMFLPDPVVANGLFTHTTLFSAHIVTTLVNDVYQVIPPSSRLEPRCHCKEVLFVTDPKNKPHRAWADKQWKYIFSSPANQCQILLVFQIRQLKTNMASANGKFNNRYIQSNYKQQYTPTSLSFSFFYLYHVCTWYTRIQSWELLHWFSPATTRH